MRLLLIAFYFPPAGGGGVQRTLKFCRDLPDLGVDVDVLAPSDPKWFALDEPLLDAIPARTTVHRARFLGPRSSFRGDALRGAHGLRRAALHARYAYERALVPDKPDRRDHDDLAADLGTPDRRGRRDRHLEAVGG